MKHCRFMDYYCYGRKRLNFGHHSRRNSNDGNNSPFCSRALPTPHHCDKNLGLLYLNPKWLLHLWARRNWLDKFWSSQANVYNWHTELTGIKTESMLLIQYLIHVFWAWQNPGHRHREPGSESDVGLNVCACVRGWVCAVRCLVNNISPT